MHWVFYEFNLTFYATENNSIFPPIKKAILLNFNRIVLITGSLRINTAEINWGSFGALDIFDYLIAINSRPIHVEQN